MFQYKETWGSENLLLLGLVQFHHGMFLLTQAGTGTKSCVLLTS